MEYKKILLILMVLAIMPFTALAIEEPTNLGTYDFTSMGCSGVALVENDYSTSWLDYTAVSCILSSTNYKLLIYNHNTNFIIFEQTVGGTGSALGTSLTYDKGYLINTLQEAGNDIVHVFDVSNIGFVSTSVACTVVGDVGKPIVFQNDGDSNEIYFGGTGTNNVYRSNSTGFCPTSDTLSVALTSGSSVDEDNLIYTANNDLYAYNNNWGSLNDTLIGSIETGRGTEFVDWNRNPNNPLYLTNLGYVVQAGGSSYNDIQTTSLSTVEGTPLFFADSDNIISVNNSRWYLTDFSDFGNPVHTQTTTVVEPNLFSRDALNKVIGFNSTTREITTYNITGADLTIFASGLNPPTIEAQFIGVNNQNRFVFLTEMSDLDGGRVYYDQQLYEASVDVEDIYITETIGFTTDDDLQATFLEHPLTSIDSNVAPFVDNGQIQLSPNWEENFLLAFYDFVGEEETNNLSFETKFTTDEGDVVMTLLGTTGGEKLLEIEFIYDNNFGNDTYTLNNLNGTTNLLASGTGLDDSEETYYVLADVDFVTQTIDLQIVGKAGLYYSGTLPFYETAQSFVGVNYNLEPSFFGTYNYWFDYATYSHTSSVLSSLSYELFDNLQAGVSIIKATGVLGAFEFGTYSVYSYGTDEDFGFSYLESSDVETFTYSADTVVLSDDDIDLLVAQAENGLLSLDSFVEGDLFTDKLNSAVEGYGFLSTASKFFLALVGIIVLIAIGGNYGGTIGAFIGALGGLIIGWYMTWIPSWILVTLLLTLVLLISFEVRKLMTGGGR